MLRERLRVVFRAELVQQLGRALDVREEEGDRAGREVAPHSIIMNQRGGELTLRHPRFKFTPAWASVPAKKGQLTGNHFSLTRA